MQNILVEAGCGVISGALCHLSDHVPGSLDRLTLVIHMIHSKLEIFTDGIAGKVFAADVNISIEGCAECDCGQRFLAG